MATTRGRDRLIMIAVAVAAVLAASIAVVQLSAAAFTDTTENPGNSWATGSVTITDNGQPSSVLFDESGIVPGYSDEKCITVDYQGDVAADIVLYGTLTGDPALAGDLEVTVHAGDATPDAFGSCDSFVASETVVSDEPLSTFPSTFATGLGSWSPAGAEERTYRIAASLASGSQAEGEQVEFRFVWEARNQ